MNKILDCFESWVEISADKIAVSDEYKTLTYRELHIYSVQLAGALSDSGVVDGDIISVQLERSVEVLVVLLALLRIGCVYVPLDSSLPNEKIRAIKSQFSCKFTIDNHFISRFYERLKNFDRSALPLTQQKSAKSGSAYLLFTSGTTGKPKGVEISRSGLENIIQGLQSTLRENEDSSYAMLSSISFDISLHQLLIP